MQHGSVKKMKQRLNKDDWLQFGLEVLVKEGEGALKIDKLCERMKVTKGSFYSHFKDRADFETQLVGHWQDTFTTRWIAELNKIKGKAPEERLSALMNLVHTAGMQNNDIAFRAWALRNPVVAEGVRKADKQRFDYVKEIFFDNGFCGAELEMRTRLFVAFHSLLPGMSMPAPEFDLDTEKKLRFDLFLRR
jgi:AcrR family transcriptional regulator